MCIFAQKGGLTDPVWPIKTPLTNVEGP